MRYLRFLVLVLVVSISFAVGNQAPAQADNSDCPSNWSIWVYGRARYCGYFTNKVGTYCPGGSSGFDGQVIRGNPAIPSYINTADELITFLENTLNSGVAQNRTGAAFIIETMIGVSGPSSGRPPSAAQLADFENRVRYAEAKGWIRWSNNVYLPQGTLNSCYIGYDDRNHQVWNAAQGWWQPGEYGLGTQCPPEAPYCGVWAWRGSMPAPDDVAFSTSPQDFNDPTIQFFDGSGSVVYQLRRACANAMGRVGPLVPAPSYTITGRTTVNRTTVLPGQQVTFSHYLRNSGPNGDTINWSTINAGTGGTVRSGSNWINPGTESRVNTETYTVPANTAFGTQICRYIRFQPRVNGSGSGQGSTVCTTVVAQFSLTPSVTANTSTAGQGDSITFTYFINNSGPTKSTSDLTCKVAGQTYGSGHVALSQQDSDRNPAISPQPFSCPSEVPTGSTQVGTESLTVGNVAPGSSMCRSLVVSPLSDSDSGPRVSAEACVIIAKAPYVHVMGNDVWAGGGFAALRPACDINAKITTTARTLTDGSVAGSATQYGAFALGKITTFGSGNKALVNPAGSTGRMLTFSNLDPNNLGNYGAAGHCIEDYVTTYTKNPKDPASAVPNPVNVSSRSSGTWDVTGDRSFSGAMPTGSQQIYLIEGNVRITGDITYPATYSSLADIPSLVIIATGDITVNRGVRQLDGIFIARDEFFTCDVASNAVLSVNPPCEQQLVINGSVSATWVHLLRTFGADGSNTTDRKRPAEVFNFNPELYLRNALTGPNANVLKTVNQQDLPPRY